MPQQPLREGREGREGKAAAATQPAGRWQPRRGPPLRRRLGLPQLHCGLREVDAVAAAVPRGRCSAAASSGPAPCRDTGGPAQGRPRVPAPAASAPALSSAGAMGHHGGWPGAALSHPLLLLGLLALCLAGEALAGPGLPLRQRDSAAALMQLGFPAGLGGPGPAISGQALAVCTLREEESRAFTCRAPRPAPGTALAWYLDGRRQEANCSAAGATSTLPLAAQRSGHQLSCSLTDPASGETYSASVLLDVQCKVRGAGLLPGPGAASLAAVAAQCLVAADERSWPCASHCLRLSPR